MAKTNFDRVQSQEALNVSQDYSSSEPRQSVIPASSPFTSGVARAARQTDDGTEERVEDSYQYELIASPKEGQTLGEKRAKEPEEEDLYGITPERTGQYRASQNFTTSTQQRDPAQAQPAARPGANGGVYARSQAPHNPDRSVEQAPSPAVGTPPRAPNSLRPTADGDEPGEQRTTSNQDRPPAILTETPSESARADPSTGINLHLSATSQTSAPGMMSERPSTGKLKSGALDKLKQKREQERLGVTPSQPPKASLSKSNDASRDTSAHLMQPAVKTTARGKGKSAAQRTQSPPPSGQINAGTLGNASRANTSVPEEAEGAQSRRKGKKAAVEPEEEPEVTKRPAGKRRSEDASLDDPIPKRARTLAKAEDAFNIFDHPESPESEQPSKQNKKQSKGKASLTKAAPKPKSQPSKQARRSGTARKSISQPTDLEGTTAGAGEIRQTRSKAKCKPDELTHEQERGVDERTRDAGLTADGQEASSTVVDSSKRLTNAQERAKDVMDPSAPYDDAAGHVDAAASKAPPEGEAGNDPVEVQADDVPMDRIEDDGDGAKPGFDKYRPSQDVAGRIMPGASQDAPIELSDNDKSSSDSDIEADDAKTPRRGETIRTVPVVSTARAAYPKTPANVPSSPPARTGFATTKSALAPPSDGLSRKTQIIAFSQSGPLNQGSVPRKALNEENLRYAQSSMPRLKIPLNGGSSIQNGTKRLKGPSSVATTARTTRSQAPAPPSNISNDVGSALASLGGKTPLSATPMPAAKMNTSHVSQNIWQGQNAGPDVHASTMPANQEKEHDSMNDFDQFVYGDSPQADSPQAESPQADLRPQPTLSQKAMPPPQTKNSVSSGKPLAEHDTQSKQQKNGVTKAESAVESKTAKRSSAQASEAPASKRAKPDIHKGELVAPIRESKAATMSLAQVSHQSESTAHHTGSSAKYPALEKNTALQHAPAAEEIPLKKRDPVEKLATSAESQMPVDVVSIAGTKSQPKTSSHAPSATPTEPAKIVPAVERLLQSPSSRRAQVADSDRFDTRHKEASAAESASQPKQSRRGPRKPARLSSRASQSVDVGGSPVPPGMEVDHRTTALDKYSQEADDSHMGVPAKSSKDHHQTPSGASQPALTQQRLARAAQRSGVLSSNKKAVPARPDAQSTAIRQVKVTEAESAMLLQSSSPPASQDPFNLQQNSRGRGKRDGAVNLSKAHDEAGDQEHSTTAGVTGEFMKQLNNATENDAPPLPKARKEQPVASGKEKTRADFITNEANVMPTRKQPAYPGKTMNATPQAKDFPARIDASVEMLRNAIMPTRSAVDEEDDPDKTLVNQSSDENSPLSDGRRHSPVKPEKNKAVPPKLPVPAPPSSSSGSSFSGSDGNDFKPWKKAFHPHQRQLYKDLVKIAHRLTQYLADQETSTEIMMDANHRQHVKYLVQEQAEQKQRYKKQRKLLKQKKKERRIEWNACRKHLQETLDSWRKNCEERERKVKEQEEENARFEELIRRMG